MSNAFGPRKPLFGPYTYRVKQNSNGDTLIAVYVGSKRIAHMDAYWAYSMRSIEGREEEVKQRGRGRSCATDLRALGAEGKYPNVLAVSHAFITDDEHKGKGVGRAMYEAMMVEGFAVRQSRIGGQPGPMFFIPDECSGAGNTSAEARRVWDSLVRDYPSQGTSIRVDAPPVIGSRKRTNPRRRNPDPTWTVEDTENLLRAQGRLRPSAQRWVHQAARANKLALLDAYDALTSAEKMVLAKSVREAWHDEGYADRRPLYRTASRHEEEGHRGRGGVSLSHKPTRGSAFAEAGDDVRVLSVAPEEVVLDSTVPNIHTRLWSARLDAVDPPLYDKLGRPTNRRSQMSNAELRAFGKSPLWSDQWGAEDEVVLTREARPPEAAYRANPSRRRNPAHEEAPDCAWCGAPCDQPRPYPNQQGEVFCSPSHRASSNRALARLLGRETPSRRRR